MRNLAGDPQADRFVEWELESAGIPAVRQPLSEGEVKTIYFGELGDFSFFREWSYWRVTGAVPLIAAQEMYNNPAGRFHVRAGGDASAPAPSAQASWMMPDGRDVASVADRTSYEQWAAKKEWAQLMMDSTVFTDDPASVGAQLYVTTYHIDSEAGLKLFADTVKRHNLVSATVG